MAQLGRCYHRDCGDSAWHVTVDESGEPHLWCTRHNIDAVRGGPVVYVPATPRAPGAAVQVLAVANAIAGFLLALAVVLCLAALLAIQAGIEVNWVVSPVGALGVIAAVTVGSWVALRTVESRRAYAF